jgi:DNA-directed RNA polymerase subunit RPC12/RpoP
VVSEGQLNHSGPVMMSYPCPHCGALEFRDIIISDEATSMVCNRCGTYTLVKPVKKVGEE